MSFLLKNGTLLLHSADHKSVKPTQADLLIVGNRIAGIFDASSKPDDAMIKDARIIDCTNKIISPGFIDTHHHCYQTQLKGRHANEGLLSYMISGNFMSSQYTPDDIFIGQLGGVLECIDGGTTTVVDHSHCNYSPEHTQAAIDGTIAAGIRSVYCYTPTARVAKWDENDFELDRNWFPDWVLSNYTRLASTAPHGDGRVSIGFAFDGWFLPKDYLVSIMKTVRESNPKVITTHYVNTPWVGKESRVQQLEEYGILGDDFLFSHSNCLNDETRKRDAEIIRQRGCHTSSTPDTELQMCHGVPICFDEYHKDTASLGIDCHSNNSSDMMSAMRLALQSARGAVNEHFAKDWKVPSRPVPDVVHAFNLATVKGAAAIGMLDEIGSLEVGKKADIVIFDGNGPSMICGSEEDAVAAVVLHASVRDVDMVFVDGIIRKEGGKLSNIRLPSTRGSGDLGWPELADKLRESRKTINQKISKLNLHKARQVWAGIMRIDEEAVVVNV